MRIAIDTNRYSDLARGLPEALAVVGGAGAVFVPIEQPAQKFRQRLVALRQSM